MAHTGPRTRPTLSMLSMPENAPIARGILRFLGANVAPARDTKTRALQKGCSTASAWFVNDQCQSHAHLLECNPATCNGHKVEGPDPLICPGDWSVMVHASQRLYFPCFWGTTVPPAAAPNVSGITGHINYINHISHHMEGGLRLARIADCH